MLLLLLALAAPAEAARTAYVGMQIGLEPHFDTVHGWHEPLINAYGEDIKFTYWQMPFAQLTGIIPGAFWIDVDFGGLMNTFARRPLPLELGGSRAATAFDAPMFRAAMGPLIGSEEAGFSVALGYEAGFVGVAHEEVSSSAAGNVMHGAVGPRFVGYLVIDETIGSYTSVGVDAVMTAGSPRVDGWAFNFDEYVNIGVSDHFGFFLHPGFEIRSAYITYDKEQKQRMTSIFFGAGILL